MFLIGLLLSLPLLAESSTNVRVETNVGGGSADVDTHIETTINGKTKVVESHEPGVIEVKGNDEGVTVNKQPTGEVEGKKDKGQVEVTPTEAEKETEGSEQLGIEDEAVVGEVKGESVEAKSWVETVMERIREWWERWTESLPL